MKLIADAYLLVEVAAIIFATAANFESWRVFSLRAETDHVENAT